MFSGLHYTRSYFDDCVSHWRAKDYNYSSKDIQILLLRECSWAKRKWSKTPKEEAKTILNWRWRNGLESDSSSGGWETSIEFSMRFDYYFLFRRRENSPWNQLMWTSRRASIVCSLCSYIYTVTLLVSLCIFGGFFFFGLFKIFKFEFAFTGEIQVDWLWWIFMNCWDELESILVLVLSLHP